MHGVALEESELRYMDPFIGNDWTIEWLFFGLEMRQSQRIAIAALVQGRSDAGMAFLTAPLEGNFQDAILNQANLELKNVKDKEGRTLLEQIITWRITGLNNAWQQHKYKESIFFKGLNRARFQTVN